MTSRAEITTKYARAYAKASKKDKGRVLDAVVDVTGWSRDNARRRLVAAARRPPGAGRQVAKRPRKPRAPKYSYDAVKVLQKVWAASGGQCGQYLAVSMRLQLAGLERHGELVDGADRYSDQVRRELLSMSAATIDRYLKGAKAADQIRGVASTKPSPLLRSAIKVRKTGDEVEAEPGFFEGDTVAHCGPTLKGEFARTLNLTCVHTGWVFTRSVRNNAHVHILGALKAGVEEVPFAVTGLDFDNGSEFLNHAVIKWAGERSIFFTRSRPYKKNDQATIESKNNHLVRKYGFYYLTPTKKPEGYGSDHNGRRTRIYDKPATPLDRLLAAQVLAPAQVAELLTYRDSLDQPGQAAEERGDTCRGVDPRGHLTDLLGVRGHGIQAHRRRLQHLTPRASPPRSPGDHNLRWNGCLRLIAAVIRPRAR